MKINESFFKNISRWEFLSLLILLTLAIEGVFSFWLMPGFTAAVDGEILDMALAYGPEKAADFLGLLSAGGLYWYNRIQIFDFFFPFGYGLALAGFLYKIYSRKYDDFSQYAWIVMIPVLGGLCDLGENLFIRIMILAGAGSAGLLGWVTSTLSTIKFLALGLGVLFIFTGLAWFLRGRKDAFKK